MLRMSFAALPLALLLSTQAFAYGGTGYRQPSDPKMPADISHNKKTESADHQSVFVEGGFSNINGSKTLFCDIHAELTAVRGTDRVKIFTTVDRRVLRAYRGFKDNFRFDLNEAGSNYRFDKRSQVYLPSCLELDPGENPDQVPSPHEKCDPEFQACDWSCPAQAQDPTACDGAWDRAR